jgi:hypothetical protein
MIRTWPGRSRPTTKETEMNIYTARDARAEKNLWNDRLFAKQDRAERRELARKIAKWEERVAADPSNLVAAATLARLQAR